MNGVEKMNNMVNVDGLDNMGGVDINHMETEDHRDTELNSLWKQLNKEKEKNEQIRQEIFEKSFAKC